MQGLFSSAVAVFTWECVFDKTKEIASCEIGTILLNFPGRLQVSTGFFGGTDGCFFHLPWGESQMLGTGDSPTGAARLERV